MKLSKKHPVQCCPYYSKTECRKTSFLCKCCDKPDAFAGVKKGKLLKPLGRYAQMTNVAGLYGFEKRLGCIKYVDGRENAIIRILQKNRIHCLTYAETLDGGFKKTFSTIIDHAGFYRTKDGHVFFMSCPYLSRDRDTDIYAKINKFCKENYLVMITADSFYNPGNTMFIIASVEDIRFIDKIEVALMENGSCCEKW